MDSEQPLHLIEQLVPLLREKDFDEIFNRLTQTRHAIVSDEAGTTRDVREVQIRQSTEQGVRLLFDPEHNLEQRILDELFASE